jgi:hypothetical protein
MSRVFLSAGTGAAIHVFADDHCPPHVHARHRGEGWIARVAFSYVGSAVELLSIAPLSNVPLRRVLNRLLHNVQARLAECRQRWWIMRRTTCLANQWAMTPGAEKMQLLSERAPEARQITDASYDPSTERLQVTFRDGTTAEVRIRP